MSIWIRLRAIATMYFRIQRFLSSAPTASSALSTLILISRCVSSRPKSSKPRKRQNNKPRQSGLSQPISQLAQKRNLLVRRAIGRAGFAAMIKSAGMKALLDCAQDVVTPTIADPAASLVAIDVPIAPARDRKTLWLVGLVSIGLAKSKPTISQKRVVRSHHPRAWSGGFQSPRLAPRSISSIQILKFIVARP